MRLEFTISPSEISVLPGTGDVITVRVARDIHVNPGMRIQVNGRTREILAVENAPQTPQQLREKKNFSQLTILLRTVT